MNSEMLNSSFTNKLAVYCPAALTHPAARCSALRTSEQHDQQTLSGGGGLVGGVGWGFKLRCTIASAFPDRLGDMNQ